MPSLLIATRNSGKLNEYSQMLSILADITWLSLHDVGLTGLEVEETGSTFAENARLKAYRYMQASQIITLADDSGLVVDALQGEPGIYSARYGAPQAKTDQDRYQHLLNKLECVPHRDRSAQFVCVTAIAVPGQAFDDVVIRQGTLEGRITMAPRGDRGFGYDPIFELPDGRTVAELPAEEKNHISHRARALQATIPILQQFLNQQ